MRYTLRMRVFGQSKNEEQTVLVLDIEQGSVGGALVSLSKTEHPRLFGDTRVSLPLLSSRDSNVLRVNVEKAGHDVLTHVHTVAARLRTHPEAASFGTVTRAVVFLSAPWGTPNFSRGRPDFLPGMRDFVVKEMESFAPDISLSFSSGIERAAAGVGTLSSGGVLLCMVGGEVTELLLIEKEGPRGYATIPHGSRTFLRTLKVHGGLSEAEVHSLFSLLTPDSSGHYEPLDAAAQHFADQFANAAQHLLVEGGTERVIVVAHEPLGEWLAKLLGGEGRSASAIHALFPDGGTITALRPQHLIPSIAAHASTPDLSLLLDALYIDRGFI